MRVAIIGAGPSGFFTAGEILKKCPGCEVHLFERRVAPYGLVRFGVAPDHQMTRRAINLFDHIAEHPRFAYFGNVAVGRDVTLAELHASYHAVVLCTGAEQPTRPDIPGSRLEGAVDALAFSRWANGEDDAFSSSLLDGVDEVVIIGNGNVALDAARMLARPAADWPLTDIAPHAMEALVHHRVKRIVVVGRRRPEDVSFTEAEVVEVASLPNWSFEWRGVWPYEPLPEKPNPKHQLSFLFNLKPVCLLGYDRVVGVRCSQAGSGDTVELPAQLVIFATGHRGVPCDGLPFDEAHGIIPNVKGTVMNTPGYYVCGWIKRGAKGLIGVNRKDAIETANSMIADRDVISVREIDAIDWAGELPRRGVRVVSWADWKSIDAMEKQNGAALGRPRVNVTPHEALKALIGSSR